MEYLQESLTRLYAQKAFHERVIEDHQARLDSTNRTLKAFEDALIGLNFDDLNLD